MAWKNIDKFFGHSEDFTVVGIAGGELGGGGIGSTGLLRQPIPVPAQGWGLLLNPGIINSVMPDI
ncbi:hypothetical protein VU10_01430 [Desulfobulbus sp. US1]|nr:hypothetical protein [Desulfobulbus sp. US1]